MRLRFPIEGLSEATAYADQELITSPSLRNVRPFDVKEERVRGGQRPGLAKVFSTRIVGDHPVIAMVPVTTTYIEPEV